MNKLQIVFGSLQISFNDVIILVIPKDACAIDSLSLAQQTPYVCIFNNYLGSFTPVFKQPLSTCIDSTNVAFTTTTFIAFAEANLGF
jgi:hypothetical protein